MPMKIEELKAQIENVREELGMELLKSDSFQECYELNLRLDSLIEEYIQLTEI